MVQRIGVLALQGDFAAHQKALDQLGALSIRVKKVSELDAIDGLVFPGGESSTMFKLMDSAFKERLHDLISDSLPILATCAGMILLANKVINPEQESLGLLDIEVERNAYGRQIDSFIDSKMSWTELGQDRVRALLDEDQHAYDSLEGVFIRAPKITKIGNGVDVLAVQGDTPVLVQQDKILAAAFHPELGLHPSLIHRSFLSSCNQ